MVDLASVRRQGRCRTGLAAVVVSLALSGCGGGGGGGGSGPAPAVAGPSEVPAEVTVSGTLQYESVPPLADCRGLDFSATELRPIRGATVELLDAASDEVIATTRASDSGGYSFAVDSERNVYIRVRAELKQSGDPGWDVELRDNTTYTTAPLANRPLYVLDSSEFNSGGDDQVLNLTAASGWDGSRYSDTRAAAPFAILDTIYQAMSLVKSADPNARFAPLDIFWSANNSTVDGSVDRGEIGTSYYRPDIDSLFLLGKADDDTEEFDRLVVAHEWGHYFEDNFSRSDSMGGSHGLSQRLDMRLAFGEGWATALAGMATGSELYCDTSGFQQRAGFGFDLERDSTVPTGWFNELSVVAILFDLWDSRSGDDDPGSVGFPAIYEVFANDQVSTPAFTSLFSYVSALKTRNPSQAALIDTLLARHNITGTDIYGSNETNGGGSGDALPVYTEVAANGLPVQVCASSEFDSNRDGNKLAEIRYLRLRLDSPGRYQIRAEAQSLASPGPGFDCSNPNEPARSSYSDPDFLLVHDGQIVLDAESCQANRETATSPSLPAGDYVMSLREYRFADRNTAADFPTRVCFNVTVTAQ